MESGGYQKENDSHIVNKESEYIYTSESMRSPTF